MNPAFWQKMKGMSERDRKRIAREYQLKAMVDQILRRMAEEKSAKVIEQTSQC